MPLDDDADFLATRRLLQGAVDGDARAMRQIVRGLTPAIRAGVTAVLARGHTGAKRAARQEVEDVTQTVLLALFADRGRVLLQWDPARGLDLPSYVTLKARTETLSVLRSRRRSPWTEDPTRVEDLDLNAVPRMGPESEAISRDMLAALSDAVKQRLSPRGAEIFSLMFLEGRSAEEVCTVTDLSSDAVYTWKSRLTRQLREIFDDLGRAPPTIPPPAEPGERESGEIFVSRASPSAPDSRERGTRGTPTASGTLARVPRKLGPVPGVPRAPSSASRAAPPAPGPRAACGGSSSVPPPSSER
jgi:RNA polymerase sigma-70 factor (ECF subfamily)